MAERKPQRHMPEYEDPTYRAIVAGRQNLPELTDELSRWACALVAQGRSLDSIFRRKDKPKGCPTSVETFLNWLTYGELQRAKGKHDSKFAILAERWSRALTVQALAGYDKLIEIEERLLNEPRYLTNPDYDPALALDCLRKNKDYPEPKFLLNPRYIEPQVAIAVTNSIKWRLARIAPEKFGDKLELTRKITLEHSLADSAPDWLRRLGAAAAPAAPAARPMIDITPAKPEPDAAPEFTKSG